MSRVKYMSKGKTYEQATLGRFTRLFTPESAACKDVRSEATIRPKTKVILRKKSQLDINNKPCNNYSIRVTGDKP